MNRQLLCTSLLMASLAMSACGGGDDDAPAPSPSPSPAPSGPLAVDTQFGDQGKVQVSLAPFGGQVAMHELPDGKLLLLGHRQLESTVVASDPTGNSTRVPATRLFAKRLLANGQPDPSYGEQGTLEWNVAGAGADTIYSSRVLSDGSVALILRASKPCVSTAFGRGCSGISTDSYLQHLLTDGKVDRSGNADGHTVLSGWQHVLRESNGQLLALNTTSYALSANFGWTLSRHSFNTVRDSSFGQQGEVRSRCKADGGNFVVDASQSIWVASDGQTSSQLTGLCMERLDNQGAVHASMPEPVQVPLNMNLTVHRMRVLADQRVMVAGMGSERSLFALSFSPDGRLSNSYGQQGVATYSVPAPNFSPWFLTGTTLISADGEARYVGAYTHPNQARAGDFNLRFTAQGQANAGWQPTALRWDQMGATGELAVIDSQQRWIVQTSDTSTPNLPSVVTFTRLQGGVELADR